MYHLFEHRTDLVFVVENVGIQHEGLESRIVPMADLEVCRKSQLPRRQLPDNKVVVLGDLGNQFGVVRVGNGGR